MGVSEHWALITTLCILAGAVVLMVGNFLRNDLVAMLIILALTLTGVLPVAEAISGFASTSVLIIACMFVVGEAILNTGIAQRVGDLIIRYGGTNEIRLLSMIMTAAACVGAFMSSTATAAIFIPITLTVAEKAGLNHKRLLIPLATASMISGMMTLVATTPNIILNAALRDQGHEALAFFSFTPFGLVCLTLAILFMALFGQNLLSKKRTLPPSNKEPGIADLLRRYQINKYEYLLRVPEHSALVNNSIATLQISAQFNVFLLAKDTAGKHSRRIITSAQPKMVFRSGDLLMVIGSPEHVDEFIERFSLEKTQRSSSHRTFFQEVGIAEVMLTPDSSLIGKSLKETRFRSAYRSLVLGIRRKGITLTENLADEPLKFGDVLLVCGSWKELLRLNQQREQYLLLTMPRDHKEVVPAKSRERAAFAILAVMVGLMTFNILPPVTAILAGTCALVLARCVPMNSVYRVVDWPTILMIAGILPLALAMQKTGITGHISTVFLELFRNTGPLPALCGLFLVTATLGLCMSSTAVAVLLAPMAVDVAVKLGISPQACAMAVASACAAAFISPLGSPVTMLVREPGGYSFADFAKTGLPMLLLSLGATMFLIWLLML